MHLGGRQRACPRLSLERLRRNLDTHAPRPQTILTLQSGRSLVSSYADAVKGQKLPGGTAYLNGLPGVLTASCPSDEATLDLKTLEAGWDTVSANVVRQAYEKFEGAMKSGKGREEALELCSQERFVAARVHTAGYMFRCVALLHTLSSSRLTHPDAQHVPRGARRARQGRAKGQRRHQDARRHLPPVRLLGY